MDGVMTTLWSGNLWLDRQTIGVSWSGRSFVHNLESLSENAPLYTGNWFVV